MKVLKTHIFNNFETLAVLTLATTCSILLLALRLKITESFFLLFLVWNLFLAAIPYFISSYLQSKKESNLFTFYSLTLIWLLFLPNAPYILTDLIHLSHKSSVSVVFDGILIAAFALSGLLFYMYSFRQMIGLFSKRNSKKTAMTLKIIIPFLTGYGIYLGRFKRWNSWNIINDPFGLLNGILEPLITPLDHGIAWVTTLSFGFGLYVFYDVFYKFQKKNNRIIKIGLD